MDTLTATELESLYRKEPRHISINDTAKIIRTELKRAFPDTKFSVRISKYSMGCHVNVRYVDGPPMKAVEAITDQFCGRGFDGSTDSTTFHDSDYQGERVHFAGSSPDVHRDITEHSAIMERIKAALAMANPQNWNNDPHEWMVLSSMDLRWETPERAVCRFVAEGCR